MTQQQLAMIMAQIIGDRDGIQYRVRYEVEREKENESSSGM